jgi:hypothetical protein
VFTGVQTIDGNGNSNLLHNYSATDDLHSFTGTTAYYRLKQIDFDGRGYVSKIIPVKLKSAANKTIISPNPFSDYININTQWQNAEIATITIFNVQGKMVVSKQVSLNKGNNDIRIDNLSNLPAGNYYLQLSSATQKIIEKIAK